MLSALVPCPNCDRHVRASELVCPFCSNGLPTDLVSHAAPSTSKRMTRAAAFVFTASVAVAGCGDDTGGTSNSGGEGGSTNAGGSGGAGGETGGGGSSAGGDGGGGDAAGGMGGDGGSIQAMYGAPGGFGGDGGAGQAEYGAPPPPDE